MLRRPLTSRLLGNWGHFTAPTDHESCKTDRNVFRICDHIPSKLSSECTSMTRIPDILMVLMMAGLILTPSGTTSAQEQTRWAIAIHGGAGGDPAQWDDEKKQARRDGLGLCSTRPSGILSWLSRCVCTRIAFERSWRRWKAREPISESTCGIASRDSFARSSAITHPCSSSWSRTLMIVAFLSDLTPMERSS